MSGTDTAVWHGGNEYGGPGAWKRPRMGKKRLRSGAGENSPLDLTAFFGESWRRDLGDNSHKQSCRIRNRSKQGKSRYLQARLKSLSLTLAPSYVVGPSLGEPLSTGRNTKAVNSLPSASSGSRATDDLPPLPFRRTPHVEPLQQSPVQQLTCRGHDTRGRNLELSTSGVLDSNLKQISPYSATPRGASGRDSTTGDESFVLVPKDVRHCFQKRDCSEPSALRIPTAATKMAVNDKCNAELLDAQATLRALLKEHKRLGAAMRRRRLEACLGGEMGDRRHGRVRGQGKPRTDIGNRRRRNNHQNDGKKAGGADRRKRRPHAHQLLFMAEADIQEAELCQMRLEDAEATNLLQLEEARRRKLDYAEYCKFSVRYGPLTEDEFELAVYPGRSYHDKVFDATRALQYWWWSVWPPVLRRRKSSALVIQSTFRGFLQRRKWRPIIRLRTLWGDTRIIAHAFSCWRTSVAKIRRVKAFTRRSRNRCKAYCLVALMAHAKRENKAREKVLQNRLRRLSQGIRLRIFEGWVRYTEVSLAVEHMRRCSATRPVFRSWREIASENRRRNRLRWACGTLASRFLRWQRRTQYVDLRRASKRVQVMMRSKIARIRVTKALRDSRIRRAEEAVQTLQDERIHRLIDDEQRRLDRLQAAIDQDTASTQNKVSTFLRTKAGKLAVAHNLAATREGEIKAPDEPLDGSNLSVQGDSADICTTAVPAAEAKQEAIRRFVRREQALLRHDFDAVSPPPLRCPRSDCDATFVDPRHYVRHAAEVHPKDDPTIAELAVVMSDPLGLAVFEDHLGASNRSIQIVARPRPQEVAFSSPEEEGEDNEIVRDTFHLWKAIEVWRMVPSSSDRYRQLGASILDECALAGSGKTEGRHLHLPDQVRDALGGEKARSLGKLEMARRMATRTLSGHLTENASENAIDPLAFEEASWQALVSLNGAVGQAFLRSVPYKTHLEYVDRRARDAVAAAAADIATRERAEWLAEAQRLRTAALRRKEETMVDDFAEKTLTLVLEESGPGELIGGLVDDQVAVLAAVIIAERRAFAKVMSAVWNEAVDNAAYITTCELRGVDPVVAGALSEAAVSLARSRLMDELIDGCVDDLTGPEGEFWPDARAMTAVADGVGYRVRCDVMEELLDASILELQGSGEAERLMSDAAQVRERRSAEGVSQAACEIDGGLSVDTPTGVGSMSLIALGTQSDHSQGRHTDIEGASSTVVLGGEGSSIDDMSRREEGIAAVRAITKGSGEGDGNWGSGSGDAPGVALLVPEERRAAALLLMQSTLRRKAAYRETKRRVARNFIKLYDPGSGAFYWLNQATNESSWDKPAIIDAFFKKTTLGASVGYLKPRADEANATNFLGRK